MPFPFFDPRRMFLIVRHYSITLSSVVSSLGGTVRPSALAVFEVDLGIENLIGLCTAEGASAHLKNELPAEMTRLTDAMSLGGLR
jgi:hypothetical protein